MNIKKLLCACMAIVMLLACGTAALAKVPSPSKEFYYLDQANVLTEATEGEIFFSNQLLEKACGAQVVVVTVKTTGSQRTKDYANELFNSWGIGTSGKHNGFLLLLAIDDDDYYALCGSNLQPKFTSGAIKEYYDDYLEDDFAAKRYDAGVKKFFEAVFARIADTYSADVTTADGIAAYQAWVAEGNRLSSPVQTSGAQGGYEEEDGSSTLMMAVLLFVIIVLGLILVSRMRRRRRAVIRQQTIVTPFVDPMTPPPMNGPVAGPGGYRGVNNNSVGAGGYRGTQTPYQTPYQTPTPRRSSRNNDMLLWGILNGLTRSSGGFRSSGGSRSSGSRSSGGFRSSGGGSRSFGSGSGGGGRTSGGGAGRGRH